MINKGNRPHNEIISYVFHKLHCVMCVCVDSDLNTQHNIDIINAKEILQISPSPCGTVKTMEKCKCVCVGVNHTTQYILNCLILALVCVSLSLPLFYLFFLFFLTQMLKKSTIIYFMMYHTCPRFNALHSVANWPNSTLQ